MTSEYRRIAVTCQLCGQVKRPELGIPASMVRPQLVEMIRVDHPEWDRDGFVCFDDLARYRIRHIEKTLEAERGQTTELERQVLQSLRDHELLTRDVDATFDDKRTFGEMLADRVAEFGGSWRFIIVFGAILFSWILINSIALFSRPFDPFPYILLNLVLSCIAAIQAPVIMMSQNRQEAKDRLRAENDYRINLKAELEIRHLNGKLDVLLNQMWEHHLEVQAAQMDMLQELGRRINKA